MRAIFVFATVAFVLVWFSSVSELSIFHPLSINTMFEGKKGIEVIGFCFVLSSSRYEVCVSSVVEVVFKFSRETEELE